jgi:hypothetical protein
MARIRKSIPGKLTAEAAAARIFRGKENRRERLTALPFEAKIEIVERLRDLGNAARIHRQASKTPA